MKLKAHIAGKRHLIWDWNGTLLDDLALSFRAICMQLREHGLPELTLEKYREVFRFPVREYYRELGFDFARTPFESLSARFMEIHGEGVAGCDLFQGTAQLLEELQRAGVELSVLSAAQQSSLEHQLKHFGIASCFTRVHGLDNHHAHSKLERGHELLRSSSVPRELTLLIGDTDHDLEVGRELGVNVLLLAEGHQSHERLSRLHDQVLVSRH